jgi:phosphate-selective porin OprO/OprP
MTSPLSAHRVALLFIAAVLAGVRGNAEDAPPLDAPAASAFAEQARRPLFSPSWAEGLVWRAIDDRLQLRIGGYVLLDWAGVGQDSALDSIAPPTGADFGVRDSQIDIRGVFCEKTQFRLQLDINNGEVELQDNFLQRDGIPCLGSLRLGHFKEPFGLENMTSLRHQAFMERSLADTLTTTRGVGMQAANTAFRERMAWSVGMFWDTDSVEKINDSQAFSLVGRLTGLLLRRDDRRELLHVGVSLAHRFMKDSLQYRARPEVDAAPRYLDTGDFSADAMTLVNLEAAYARGPLLLQGEAVWARSSGAMREEQVTLNDIADEAASRYPHLTDWLQGRTGWERPSNSILWNIPLDLAERGEVTFFGVYGQAAYVLTGEQRPYDARAGVFGNPVPAHPFSFRTFRGTGAWEAAARLSHLDLNESYIQGGRETNATLGVNWYLNENVRMALNYVHGEIGRDTYEGAMDAVQWRMQLDLQPRRFDEFYPWRDNKAPSGPVAGNGKN